MKHVLAGDIGGTRARFALVDRKSRAIAFQDVLESRSFATFDATLSAFLDRAKKVKGLQVRIAAASFGIAGPVVDNRVKATNLPWIIDGKLLSKHLGGVKVTLLNDLVALGYGALAASSKDVLLLHGGKLKKEGNVAIIAAGTGLGEAAFIWDGEKHIACSSEGGHTDYAPKSAVEEALYQKLAVQHGHVSWERVCAGSSISMIYEFLVRDHHVKEGKAAAAKVTRAPDANVAVVELAESGKSEAAMQAIELWSSIYGAEAGNLALKVLATGGVYVCGGVSAHLAPILAKGIRGRKKRERSITSPFLDAFLDKGRMRGLLEAMPVAVVLDPKAGLLGAAAHAAASA